MTMHKTLHAAATAAAAAATLLLAACGESPSAELPMPAPPPAASNEVPSSATASTLSWGQYAASLAKTETGLPLEVNKLVPPTSETELPLPVI